MPAAAPSAKRPNQYNSPRRPMTLRARVLSGLFWVGGTRLLGQILTWAITIVVIRLLTPGDYGLLAMATVFMGFLSLVAEAGLGPRADPGAEARRRDAATNLRRRDRGQLRAVRAAVRRRSAGREILRRGAARADPARARRPVPADDLRGDTGRAPDAEARFQAAIDDRPRGIGARQPRSRSRWRSRVMASGRWSGAASCRSLSR